MNFTKCFSKLWVLLFFSVLFATSCAPDNSDIYNRLEQLEKDVTSLKEQTTALQKLVSAAQSGKLITTIEDLGEGKLHKITFNDGTSINVSSGAGVPVIGVKEEGGVYYWTSTVDGKTTFLTTAGGEKMPVSGAAPAIGVDKEGYWTVNGKRLQDASGSPVKAAGKSFFKKVEDEDDVVVFTLADDTEIVLSKAEDVYLRFAPYIKKSHYILKRGESMSFDFNAAGVKDFTVLGLTEGWSYFIHKTGKDVKVSAPADRDSQVVMRLQGTDKNGMVYQAVLNLTAMGSDFDDANGVFVLSEGNMSSECGKLAYITPGGVYMDYIYLTVNDRRLGTVMQDLTVHDGKIYMVSQNGADTDSEGKQPSEGFLTVANLKTLEKVATYQEELASSPKPTHVAVLDDEHIYLRINRGMTLFNSVTKKVTKIELPNNTVTHPMPVIDGKVYMASSKKDIYVFDKEHPGIAATITLQAEGNIKGILPAEKGHLWVALQKGKAGEILKLKLADNTVVKRNEIAEWNFNSFVNSVLFQAKGNIIYFNKDLKIYKHDFDQNKTTELIDAKTIGPQIGLSYNQMGVHPVTGKLYLATIADYALYGTNHVIVLNDDGEKASVEKVYRNYTRFPAGFFFPGAYKQ